MGLTVSALLRVLNLPAPPSTQIRCAKKLRQIFAADTCINTIIREWLMRRLGAKCPRGHPKGGLDPSGSRDRQEMDVPPPPTPGGGSELSKAASL